MQHDQSTHVIAFLAIWQCSSQNSALCLSQGVSCAGQVALSSQEAEALKESRQTSATKDWLMDTEPTSQLDATGSSMTFPYCQELEKNIPVPSMQALRVRMPMP